MNLGGIDLLVQSAVDARETAPQEARNMQDAKTATQDPRNTEDAICEKLQNTRVSHENDSEVRSSVRNPQGILKRTNVG